MRAFPRCAILIALPRRGHGWASRAVLAGRLSNTMDVSFCLDALEVALSGFEFER
jgi:hypothetical protein